MSGSRVRLALALAALILAGGVAARHAYSQRDPATLVLYTTASQNGELAPCG